MKIIAIIPARSGSKSIVDKNIRDFMGKPMLAHTIEHAKDSKYIDRVIVSTDSEQYAEIARAYGAETPFLRPAIYATDTALDIDVFRHALDYLREQEQYIPDIVVHLRPTYPIRDVNDMDAMIEMLINAPQADAVRCIVPAEEIPYKMWRYQEDTHRLTPLLTDIPEAYNSPRQSLPLVYYQNACVDVIRASTISQKNSMTGDVILGYRMTHNYDIDYEADFVNAQRAMKVKSGKNKFVFDIDGVVAQFREDLSYANAGPNTEVIKVINALYASGNYIVLFTARGYKTGIDWRDVTEQQLASWGVHYHELKFGKPDADYYVDDKMLDLNELLKIMK